MKKRSIILMILLIIITASLYLIYWTCSFQNQLKKETGKGFGGLGHFLMLIFTLGIYYIYWQYAAGKRLEKLGLEDHSVLYFVFCFIGLAWLNPFLMQAQANKLSKV